MKTNFTLLTILICALLLGGCSKSEVTETAQQRVARLLTGSGNRYWHISEIYVNGNKQVLTSYQMLYTKTFTASPENANGTAAPKGTFTDENNYVGPWTLTSATQLDLTIANGLNPIKISYTINSISETALDMTYTANSTTQREVYYGY